RCCRCLRAERGTAPNENTCPTCAGLPVTLPLLNQRAVEFAGMISLALGCKIPDEIMFYRKNYFYPDLPKNFQLTQYNAYGISSIGVDGEQDRKSTRLNSSHVKISYAVFCLKKKRGTRQIRPE